MTNSDDVSILVVEDSATQALKLRALLEANQYRAFLATNGEQALESIRQNKPTVVISDVVMPGMNGFELCQAIKTQKEWTDIPVILLTSLSDPEDVINGLRFGADSFIVKPYEETLLLSRVQYVLANREIRKQTVSALAFEIYFGGRRYTIESDRMQLIDLLLSTYESALHKARELAETHRKLAESMDTIKTLRGLIPICAHCKKIRDDQGFWQQLERYIEQHSDAHFSHGLCPECVQQFFPNHGKAAP